MYRLRRQGSGRTRLDGTPSGSEQWQITVPRDVVTAACHHTKQEPQDVRFDVKWDSRRKALVYFVK